MSPLTEPTRIILRNGWQPMDPDAAAYITAVETADGQALEEPVKIAIDSFVLGCKADGIWSSIKASCILSGARTVAGALQPLVGPAPSNIGPFANTDYNRKAGLKASGTSKYLNTNYSQASQPQDSRHLSVYTGSVSTTLQSVDILLFAQDLANIRTALYFANGYTVGYSAFSGAATVLSSLDNQVGFLGHTRSSSEGYESRVYGDTGSFSISSTTASASNYGVFARLPSAGSAIGSTSQIAFYSIGESLDLAKLDARVTDLINKFAEVIP